MRIKGVTKCGETDSTSNQFPKCFPQSETHKEIHTDLGREEKGEAGDRGNVVEKKENQKGERALEPVISLPSKNGTEDCVLKGPKLITTTKKQR